jgi:hypothetical protein
MKHTFYGTWREADKPMPCLEVLVHELLDDTEKVEEAGAKFGRWLSDNASAAWMKGLREAMGPPPAPYQFNEEGSAINTKEATDDRRRKATGGS